MSRDDPGWDEFVEFARSRPKSVRDVMREWPPLATVKTKPGIILLIPAPGVEGEIQSYFEDGDLGVVAPLTIPHPKHGWGRAKPGDLVKAEVSPDQLLLVRENRWTREDVREALDGC